MIPNRNDDEPVAATAIEEGSLVYQSEAASSMRSDLYSNDGGGGDILILKPDKDRASS